MDLVVGNLFDNVIHSMLILCNINLITDWIYIRHWNRDRESNWGKAMLLSHLSKTIQPLSDGTRATVLLE